MTKSSSGAVNALKAYAIAMGVLAAVVLMTLAVITGFKETGKVDNTTADLFSTAITIFGSFAGILVIAMMAKVVIGLMRSG